MYRSRQRALKRWLENNYDYTIIDCPPSLALQVRLFFTVGTGYIVPAIPDRLSVRGSLYLLQRIQARGYKLKSLGTLWSLYREKNAMHKRVIKAVEDGLKDYRDMPRPFSTVIPNAAAIAASTEPDQKPGSFTAKYGGQFAKKYRALCDEIVKRCQVHEAAGNDRDGRPATTT